MTSENRLSLDPDQILSTAQKLSLRIYDRFPDSGLAILSKDLCEVARVTVRQVNLAHRPTIGLRIIAWLLIGLGLAILIQLGGQLHTNWDLGHPGEFIQSFQAAIESAVFLVASILFVLGWENRIKRRRALNYLRELRTIAHLVDMHQLNKTPDTIRFNAIPTPNSPKRLMSPFQLARYFGFCSEMLSIVGKLATLYAQEFSDNFVSQSVDQIEDLTTSLSSKIWQKSMLITPKAAGELFSNPNISENDLNQNT